MEICHKLLAVSLERFVAFACIALWGFFCLLDCVCGCKHTMIVQMRHVLDKIFCFPFVYFLCVWGIAATSLTTTSFFRYP